MHARQHRMNFSENRNLIPVPILHNNDLCTQQDATEPIQELTVEAANIRHIFWAKEICYEMYTSAIARGTGISSRSPQYIQQKMMQGEAIIAFSDDGRWAGFSYISAWEGGKFVSNSGLIVAPEFRKSGIARKIKNMVFKLGHEKYPNAKIFSLTSGLAVMKMNHKLSFKPATYSELTSDDAFWEGCKSCVN